MQFNFNCEKALGCNIEGFAIIEGSFQTAIKPGYILFVNEILDSMGYNSSKAQGLNTIITSASKFFDSNHRIFIKAKGNLVIGILKVGTKKLFLRDERANYRELTPLCVLDFYVNESLQRGGHGKSLFEFMLKFENTQPKNLAYDRPSKKVLAFLSKHYNLNGHIVQNNNYVVFNDFFEELKTEQLIRGSRSNRGVYNGNSLANFGQNLINGSINNPIQIQHKSSLLQENENDRPLATPNKLFANYFLNGQNTSSYDQIYSKKKWNLLNDYLSGEKLPEYDYIKQQTDFKAREIMQAQERVKQLETNIHHENQNSSFYNKRNEYSTLFDDKKTLERMVLNRHNDSSGNSDNNDYEYNKKFLTQNKNISQIINPHNSNTQFSRIKNKTPIKSNIMPTTSSNYGAYYLNMTNDNNKIYYY